MNPYNTSPPTTNPIDCTLPTCQSYQPIDFIVGARHQSTGGRAGGGTNGAHTLRAGPRGVSAATARDDVVITKQKPAAQEQGGGDGH